MFSSSIGKKIGMGYAVALFFLIVISVSSAWSIQQLNNSERLVYHTVDVLRTISDVTFEIRNLQSSVRGYGLTGDRRFLDPYYSSISVIDSEMAKLKELTSDNPLQQQHLEQMAHLIAKFLDREKRSIDTRDKEGLNAVAALLATFGGESLTLEFLRLASAMADEERRLLTSRKTVSEENSINAFLTIGLGTALAFLVTLSVNLFITRSLTSATRNLTFAAEKIGQGNNETRVTVLSDDELGKLGAAFNVMAERLQVNQAALTDQDWLKSNLAKFNRLSQGQRDIASLCKQILVELAFVA